MKEDSKVRTAEIDMEIYLYISLVCQSHLYNTLWSLQLSPCLSAARCAALSRLLNRRASLGHVHYMPVSLRIQMTGGQGTYLNGSIFLVSNVFLV